MNMPATVTRSVEVQRGAYSRAQMERHYSGVIMVSVEQMVMELNTCSFVQRKTSRQKFLHPAHIARVVRAMIAMTTCLMSV